MPHEAKSWVVIAMADNHHGSGAELATAVETFSNEGSTDALPLPRRRDSHRCEAHDSHLLVTGEDHGENMMCPRISSPLASTWCRGGNPQRRFRPVVGCAVLSGFE